MPLAPLTAPFRLLLVILLTILALACPSQAQQDLPANPLIRQGVLANGLRYTVVRHPAAPGAPPRVALSLRADFGSLDEDDHERGSARAAELLARASIIASPAAATLRTLGVQPETDLQTGVGYEWCAFTLAVPATPPATTAVRAALESLARAFAKPPAESLAPEGWANLRATMDERERAAMGTALRANTTLLPRLMPESRYATRFPMGPGSLDPALTVADADAFRSKWLVPSNAALVVAGDGLSLDELETLTRNVFARVPGGPRPARVPIGPVEAKQPTALVLHDPGLATDFIQLTRGLAPPAPGAGGGAAGGIDSTAGFLDDLAARVLFEIVSRRIDEAAPDAPGVRKAIMPRISRFFTLSAVIAGGPAGSAQTLARALISTTRDLQTNPVTDADLNAAKAAVLSAFDAEARAEPSLSPEKAVERYAEAMTLRDTPLSAPQRAELARTLIARVTPEAVIAAARHRLDLDHTALVALLPTPAADEPEASPLNEPALLAAFDTPEPPARAEQPLAAGAAEAAASKAPSRGAIAPAKPLPAITDLLPKEAPTDAVTTIELHPPSGVFTAGFTNAAVFHHRAMPSSQGDNNTSPGSPTGRIVLTVAFGIGPADETPDTRALSTIALAALKEPATATISAADFRRLLDENSLSTDILLAADAVTLVINAPSDRAQAGFAVASTIASQGALDRTVFDRAPRPARSHSPPERAHTRVRHHRPLRPRCVPERTPRPRRHR
jgi:predicted Zn-dependent peptidase